MQRRRGAPRDGCRFGRGGGRGVGERDDRPRGRAVECGGFDRCGAGCAGAVAEDRGAARRRWSGAAGRLGGLDRGRRRDRGGGDHRAGCASAGADPDRSGLADRARGGTGRRCSRRRLRAGVLHDPRFRAGRSGRGGPIQHRAAGLPAGRRGAYRVACRTEDRGTGARRADGALLLCRGRGFGRSGKRRGGRGDLQFRWDREAPHGDRRGRVHRQRHDAGAAAEDRRAGTDGSGFSGDQGRTDDGVAVGHPARLAPSRRTQREGS